VNFNPVAHDADTLRFRPIMMTTYGRPPAGWLQAFTSRSLSRLHGHIRCGSPLARAMRN